MIESKINKELERKIDLYVNGRLDAEQVDELWSELIQDEYYMDYMKSVANLKAVIDRKQAAKPSSKVHSFRKVAQYAAAAAVILIASVVGVLNMNPSGDFSVSPIAQIGLDVVRDAEGVSATVTSDVIRRAIRLATDGEVQEAISLLQSELEEATEPQLKAEIALSLGSIQYNNGNYSSSIENFKIVTAQENIEVLTLEKGYWFLGNTYFQLDRLEEAGDAFQKAYELNGAYSRVAKTYVDALENVSR
ncbi:MULTISPECIES: tetratricopeptide repeat protein [Gracilimonas]|uniref:Tetratricopeptide repeat protein n=1 Tax=Gracilimonas sediminicola TaxID=2952158 RepID=A0A9X2L698_9BACT|nr:tetratricopeptide repeat protein [Gracilimonas sediminicola]MCP9292368.1 tetratricopeptide repeat protein [Gracilimonas sediminicola]